MHKKIKEYIELGFNPLLRILHYSDHTLVLQEKWHGEIKESKINLSLSWIIADNIMSALEEIFRDSSYIVCRGPNWKPIHMQYCEPCDVIHRNKNGCPSC